MQFDVNRDHMIENAFNFENIDHGRENERGFQEGPPLVYFLHFHEKKHASLFSKYKFHSGRIVIRMFLLAVLSLGNLCFEERKETHILSWK